jgi:hypothetical protein
MNIQHHKKKIIRTIEHLKSLLSKTAEEASLFTPEQLYTLDATGVVIVRSILPTELVLQLKEVLDVVQESEEYAATHGVDPISYKFSFIDLDPLFMDIMQHPWIMDACKTILGPTFRFDHAFGRSQNNETMRNLHGGPFAAQGSCYFHGGLGEAGKIFAGHINFAIPLTHQSPETGGYCYIPGSHKSSFLLTGQKVRQQIVGHAMESECVVIPTLNPGDIMLQPECLVHGNTLWNQPHRRKVLYYAYSPSFMTFVPYEKIAHLLPLATTPLQKRLLRPPYVSQVTENWHNKHREPTV